MLKWLLLSLLAATAFAQNPPIDSPLLDHLTGKWVVEASLGTRSSTHVIEGEWIIQHHYLRLHETSREKDAKGNPQYEAMVFLTSGPQKDQIACVWLDVFGGADRSSVGIADPKENDIPFVFKDDSGAIVFTNEFTYDPKADAWQWTMNNVDHGKATPFGIWKLRRATQ